MMLTHYLGENDANKYLKALNDSKLETGKPDYNKAQQVVNDSIRARTHKEPPKNKPILDYLILFNSKLNKH